MTTLVVSTSGMEPLCSLVRNLTGNFVKEKIDELLVVCDKSSGASPASKSLEKELLALIPELFKLETLKMSCHTKLTEHQVSFLMEVIDAHEPRRDSASDFATRRS